MDVDDELTREIEAQVNEWSTNSTECMNIELVRGDGSIDSSFQPEFTYPIFGDEEAIFGYRDLSITVSFAAHNLRPHVEVKHGKVFPAQGEVRPTDIQAALADFLPKIAFAKKSRDEALRDENASQFIPPGERIHTYTREGETYHIFCANLSDPNARELLQNVEALVPMFIEGGTALELSHDWTAQRWNVFFVYREDPQEAPTPLQSQYALVGYGTSYRFLSLPNRENPSQSDIDLFSSKNESIDSILPQSGSLSKTVKSPLDLPSRERLSQFLILPPFQKAGHGQELYHTMYKHLSGPANIREFVVEDPNEAFDDLRDVCDLLYLRAHSPTFASLRIQTNIPEASLASNKPIPTDLIVPIEARKKIQAESKILPRQFDRLVEMHTLSFIPAMHRSRKRITKREKSSNEHDRAYFFWRLYAKQRLYIFNRDQLIQIEHAERIEKLEAALDGVVEGYLMLLDKVTQREESGHTMGGLAQNAKLANRKRKVIEEDGDDDAESTRSSKKAHVDD
ncbi:acyl-CoA N-acyltransferase [Acrodontium crateriforme]|uniref:Histone acetyltransferase type B catalytic subunit n=1 Tax=Acrodontium crateriforme TaxID=150365 RepID=A0AAQ3RDB6_9PEZI|nr:acyl-CoA N-acyltransferase [Acrodontium crateriforme]